MTYEEVKARLTKCEVKLRQLQLKDNPAQNSKNYNTAVEKLTLLKESLQKQLKEAEQGMVQTSDAAEAEKLAKKGINVDLKTEQDGVAFSKEETAAIAKQVGKAVAKSLHGLGDEVAHMKAKDIEPNSFEIYVQYKKDTADDTFSFYISGDTLHLVDFSFDKELGGVGVKPSGEAIVHVDVLANELTKHFNAMQEGMSDQEWADAEEADRLEKHPEKDTIKKIQALIAAQQKKEGMYIDDEEWEKEMGRSPEDTEKAIEKEKAKLKGEATKGEEETFHKKLDTLVHKTFGKREEENEMKHPGYKSASNQYAGRSPKKKMSASDKEALRQDNRDFIQRLKDKGMLEEAPEGMYYIKVPKDAASQNKAQVILNDFYGIDYEISDNPDGVVLYFPKEKYDAGMLDDLDGDGVEILDSNIPDIVGEPDSGDTDYTQRRKAEKDYMEEASSEQKNAIHDLQNILDSVSELGEEAREIVRAHFPNMLSKGDAYGVFDFGSSANRYDTTLESFIEDLLMMADEESDLDEDAKERVARAAAAAKELATKIAFGKFDTEHGEMDKDKPNLRKYIARPGSLEEDDIDVGHQDDEPSMLKQQVYDIATYAAKLYKILDKYDQMDAEVDFPHWWQSKVILARDYVSAAQHYLEFEEKQPALDQLALEESVNESHAKLKREYDELVGKMKQLAKHFKTAEGEKKAKIVTALKQHTARKRELEKLIDQSISGMGAGQELDGSVDELFGPKVSYDEIIGGIIKRFHELKKYVSKKEPDAMDDLQQVLRAFEIFDEKMAYGAHEELEEDHSGNPNDKYVVRPCKNKKEPWAVWEGEKRVKGFADKKDAQAFADKKNKEQGLTEAKATCCGKCGRVHVKGTECKRPFLKGKDHCRYN